MNTRRFSRYWLLVPLILVAIVARDWAERPQTFDTEETVDMRGTLADYYLEDFTTRRFDQAGALEYVVSGKTLSHYPDDNRSEVDAPRVELRRDGAIWNVRALSGRFDTEPDVFTLNGDVELVRTADATSAGASATVLSTTDDPSATASNPAEAIALGQIVIRTADLSLGLDSNEIRTDAPFEIESEAWQLSGVGLRSSIDEGKLVMLSNVNGTYDAAAIE